MSLSAKELFQDALDVPPHDRLAWLRDKCGGDDALRAKVEALLSAHDDATRLDRGPRIALTEPHVAKPAASSATPAEQPGAIVDGRYELISLLGEGGFGIVYRARQLSPVVRDVALKILRGGLDSHQIVARFEAERQTLALMDHPGIARVYDAGETAQGRPYIAMEFVDGEPITAYCERHTLGLEERLRLVEQVCMAVQHAHTKGVIHRDLKPTNILVTTLDGAPFPTVIDFGIAKAVDPDASAILHGGVQLTQEFQVIGTPQYMSPEQATRGNSGGGAAGGVDTRSDVYSIGTLLYELVAGVPPFDPAELRKAGFEGVLRVIRERTPARPSTRLLSVDATSAPGATTTRTFGEAPSRLSRRVAGDVDWIVMRALEKEPARRYQSAAEFAADIRRHLSHEPVLAGPPSRLYQARKFVRRHRAAVAAAAVVAMALAATAVISLVSARRSRVAERAAIANADRANAAEAVAVKNERAAQRELAKANAVVGFTDNLLSAVGPAVARGRDTTLLREILDEAARTSPEKLKGQPLVDLFIREMIARVMFDLGEMGKAYDLLRPAWDATESLPDHQDRLDRLPVGSTIGQTLAELGRVDEADQFLRALLAEFDRLGIGRQEQAVDVTSALAGICLIRNDFAQAKELSQRALDVNREERLRDRENVEMNKNTLANAMFGLGDYAGATAMWEEALADTVKRSGADSPGALAMRMSLGTVYRQLGKLDDADLNQRAALEANRRIHQPGDPDLLTAMSVYGDLLNFTGRLDEAAGLLDEAHAQATLKLPPENAIVLSIEMRRAKVYADLKRYDEAIAVDRGVLDTTLRIKPVDEERMAEVLGTLAQAQVDSGRPRDAIASAATYVPKGGWSTLVSPYFQAWAELPLARAHLLLGELDAARGSAARARALFDREGRTKGKIFARLAAIEADIGAAATRPVR